MVNIEEFTKRLNQIMEYYDLSAASFADKIEVGRSSISHLLSGRNNPSLDFVMKIVKSFPEVELYWLLNGKGNFPHKPGQDIVPPTPSNNSSKVAHGPKDLFSDQPDSPPQELKNSLGKNVNRIVIFYTDGTFDSFQN